MKKLAIAIVALTVMSISTTANAAACRNAQGHFIKCATSAPAAARAPAAPATHAAAAHATAARPPASHTAATTARRTPCRDAKGRFKKC